MCACWHISRQLSWPTLQLVTCLIAVCGVQRALTACATAATYTACPTALEAAQFLVGTDSPLEISNAIWVPSDCYATENVWINNSYSYNVPDVPNRIKISDFSCHALGAGTVYNMSQGALVLSNGNARMAAVVTNTNSSTFSFQATFNGTTQDQDVSNLAVQLYNNSLLFDTLNLTFDVKSSGTGKVFFQYVFGSDEYPNWAPSVAHPAAQAFNDMFAFYIWPVGASNHSNVALLPNSTMPVSIGSVNPVNNSNLFVMNTYSTNTTNKIPTASAPGPYANAMNGYTVLMNTSTYTFTAGTTYRIKLSIVDMQDGTFDSNVWIKAGSLQFASPPISNCSGYWTNATACTLQCGGGNTSPTYIYKWPASGGGVHCSFANSTVNSTACNTQPCPINCTGGWVNTTNCSKDCGNGTLTQTFIITTPAQYNGTNCNTANGTIQPVACNTQACPPVNCIGSWANTTNCSKSCGNGTLTQAFIVTTPAAYGGTNCTTANGTTQIAACNTQACPVNCVGSWVNMTTCSMSCGGGNVTQTYIVTTPAANGGTNCAVANGMTQAVSCNTQPCPVNCVGSWVNTTTCSKSCGGGLLTQTYVITTPAAYGGTNCTAANGTTQSAACNTQVCPPVNCAGNWGNTTNCSKSCGNGTLTQTFIITTPAAYGGTNCTAANGTTQTAACNTQACPINCVGSWVNTTGCSVSCGGGNLTQTYIVTTPAANGGTNCTTTNGTTQTAACNTQSCPINCVGSWVNTTTCSKSCGGGTLTQMFIITSPAAYGGTNCSAANGTTQSAACNTQACAPVNCVASWVNSTGCSQPCGGGTLNQTYVITTPGAYGGTNCTAANGTTQSVACNTLACAPVNCVAGWVNTTGCSQPCGGGTLTQTYVITTSAAYGGTNCTAANGTTQSAACNTQVCPPVNCAGNWVNTTNCSKSCGNGTLTQTFIITSPAAYGGTNCTAANGTTQTAACNTQACPINCVGSWVNTTGCSVSCGGGNLAQTYIVTTPAANGGTNCTTTNGTTQTAACNTQSCPLNCVGTWVNTTTCSKSCGGGTLTQTYVTTAPAAYGGTNCTATNGTTQSVACNAQACAPVNCVASWINTTGCSQPCGGGTLTKTYVINTPAAYGGTNCTAANGTTQTATCNTQACAPVNCDANWINTTGCSQPCGGGTLTQTYVINTPAAYGGTNCTAANGTTQTTTCNTQACAAVDCDASWVNTTGCSQPCGGGTLTQIYVINTPAAYGGTNCTAANGTTQTTTCNTQACAAVDCDASWVNTTECSQPCGGGTLTQTYVINTPAAYGGTNCTAANGTTQTTTCNTQDCAAVDCDASWVNTTECSQPCGGGTLTQTYVINTAAYGGTNCTAANGTTQTATCNTQACAAVDCDASWVNTTECSQPCGGGTLTQIYVINTPAAYGGTNCTAANGTTQTTTCNTQACAAVDCDASWVNTTECSQPCGGGTLTQTYVINTPAAYGGTNCTAANGTTQTATCNTQACAAVDCDASWVNTTECSQPCGGGTLTQIYVINTPAAYGGTNCTAANGTTQTTTCNTQACAAVDCDASWVNTTECSQPCGGGTLTQTYVITTPAAYGGANCTSTNGTTQTVDCNTQDCAAVDCDASWVNTTECSQPCGGGTLTQTYVITTPAAYGGANCTSTNGTTQTVDCNTQDCAQVDCVGDWVNTTDCSQPCGGGTLTQTYMITTPTAYGGSNCTIADGTSQAAPCNTQNCKVDCEGSWVDSTDCNQPCGGGTLTQTYVVTTPAAYGGIDCTISNATTQTAACNTQACPPPSPAPAPPSPSPSPAVAQPAAPSSPATVPSPTPNASPVASPPPSPRPSSSPSPRPSPSPSPSPRPPPSPSPLPRPSPSPSPSHHPNPSPSPSPSPSPAPAPSVINQTVLDQIPYYISPPVLPPLPPMNDTNITIRGGNVTITGVKVEAGGVSVADNNKAMPASPAPTGATLPQANLTLRWAAFNGSLGFYTLGVTITVYGEFVLQRTMNWTWNTQYSAWTTEVSITGHFVLTREVDTNGQLTATETLNPGVSGLLTLFNSKYPGPGFSGSYDWAGLLDMVPDPFAYWGIRTLGSGTNSTRRLMAVPETVEKAQCCHTIPGRLLLQTDNGNTPVQGRVSVREVNSKAVGDTNSQGQSPETDEEISAIGPVTDRTAGSNGSTSQTPGFFQALLDPRNRKYLILAAVVAPSGLAVCVASIIGAVLYRKKRRREEEQKNQQQKLKVEQDGYAEAVAAAAAAEMAGAGGSTATSSAVPARRTRRRRTGKAIQVGGKDPAQLSSSGGGSSSAGGRSSLTGAGMATTSHIEFLDPADASQFASFTGYNVRSRKHRPSLTGPAPMEEAEEDRAIGLDPNHSLSGSGVASPRSPGKHKGRFVSITGSVAGMASSIAGAINHFRHSQTGQAYKVTTTTEPTVHGISAHNGGLTSPRSTVELPRERRERGPTLPGSAGADRGSLDLGRQGLLDLNAYPGGQRTAVDWGSAGVFLNSSGQTKLTPPNSSGQTRLTPPSFAARTAAAATAPRPRQDPARSVPAQWALPTLDTTGAQSRNAAWATGKAAAWAAELQAASRGSTPPPNGSGDGDDEVVTGGTTFLLPSRSRRFGPGGK